jgi:hypothetical protein
METWFRGNQWPPADVANYWNTAKPSAFPRAYWGVNYFAITVLGEFVRASVPRPKKPALTWDRIVLKRYPRGVKLRREINELIELIEYRPGVMAEALAQRTNPWAYYRGILMCNSSSAPYTRLLIEIATRVGTFQAMHYKRRFNRPRPSQIAPALLPPIDVPGHPSYPSGHSTEAHLISRCLAEVMPPAVHTPPPPTTLPPPPPPQVTPIKPWSPLERMAQRIARNREVLGLHYPSDSEAGQLLARQTFRILMRCPTIRHRTRGILALARREWR